MFLLFERKDVMVAEKHTLVFLVSDNEKTVQLRKSIYTFLGFIYLAKLLKYLAD